jgi:hypothetical protein
MNAQNKKYIVNGADFDELLRKLTLARANAKDSTQPRKAKSVLDRNKKYVPSA